MAVMTGSAHQVVRISSDVPVAAAPLPAAPSRSAAIAPLLPVQRDRRARRARRGSTRRLTVLAVAFATSLLLWVAIIAAVATLARAL